jgi:7-cyano-7-deazaguanine synthase
MTDRKSGVSAVVVVSGGLDSVTLLHYIHEAYPQHDLHAISFNYGQRHFKELKYAAYHAQLLHATHEVVDISGITHLLGKSGSSLVSGTDVPEGHYAEETMKATVVPNRNMIMASIAAGYAVAIGADFLALGVHAGDHFIYPDCRPNFFTALNSAVVIGNEDFGNVPEMNESPWWKQSPFILTPFIDRSKADIARAAKALDVDVSMTWSCYKGGDHHCGKCGTCVERLEALHEAEIADGTVYEDEVFWKEQVSS